MGNFCSKGCQPLPRPVAKPTHSTSNSISTTATAPRCWKKAMFIDTDSVEQEYWGKFGTHSGHSVRSDSSNNEANDSLDWSPTNPWV